MWNWMLGCVVLFSICGCGGSKMVAHDENEPKHPLRIIATDPSGFEAADAIAKALEARDDFDPRVLDVAGTSKLLSEMNIKTSKAQLPENLKRLRAKEVDGWMEIDVVERKVSDDPGTIKVRLSSTHDPSRFILIEWTNAWGGMRGSIADATMRKDMEGAAEEIAEEIAKQINERIQARDNKGPR